VLLSMEDETALLKWKQCVEMSKQGGPLYLVGNALYARTMDTSYGGHPAVSQCL